MPTTLTTRWASTRRSSEKSHQWQGALRLLEGMQSVAESANVLISASISAREKGTRQQAQQWQSALRLLSLLKTMQSVSQTFSYIARKGQSAHRLLLERLLLESAGEKGQQWKGALRLSEKLQSI